MLWSRFHSAEEKRASDRARPGPDEEEELKIGDFLEPASRGELLVRIPVYIMPDGFLTSDVRRFGMGLLPEPQFHMHYLSKQGAIFISRRDGSLFTDARDRIYEDIRKDHNIGRPQLRHTLHLNDCVVAMLKANYKVSGGYRGCQYLPRGYQLVPDARMSAHLYLGEVHLEFLHASRQPLRSTHDQDNRDRARQQLAQHVDAARRAGSLTVFCVCENEELMEVARQEAEKISRVEQVRLSVWPLLRWRATVAPPQAGRPQTVRRVLQSFKFFLEFERSATTRRAIRQKLLPYVLAVRTGYDVAVIFICETRQAAALFREVHQNLQREFQVSLLLITSTYAEVSAGSFDSCWNLNGKTVRLVK